MIPFEKFKAKVTSMSGVEMLELLIHMLENPLVELDMNTFGTAIEHNKRCYGCAATNVICNLLEIKPEEVFETVLHRMKKCTYFTNVEAIYFIECFEYAIDRLRLGDIVQFNIYMSKIKGPQIPELNLRLEPLNGFEWEDLGFLHSYKNYAEELRNAG